mmetsp:Transcript_11914/g.39207  ORF Transcript_11914/g.39207 Transcript_11914/m.39207 type:complete len:207 (+) Transcript_11914:2012-2632(+)
MNACRFIVMHLTLVTAVTVAVRVLSSSEMSASSPKKGCLSDAAMTRFCGSSLLFLDGCLATATSTRPDWRMKNLDPTSPSLNTTSVGLKVAGSSTSTTSTRCSGVSISKSGMCAIISSFSARCCFAIASFTAWYWCRSITHIVTRLVVTTVALRGASYKSASSPKQSPGPMCRTKAPADSGEPSGGNRALSPSSRIKTSQRPSAMT